MNLFSNIPPMTTVDPADRASAIDFVNRVNWWFETWDIEAMINAFVPDSVTYHFHGKVQGHDEQRKFFENEYPYFIPGVSRHATNHIVDADGDGVVVRYHNLLVRYATPESAAELGDGKVVENNDVLPSLWVFAPMMDRLCRTESGWKIFERHLGGSSINLALNPETTDPVRLAPFMPKHK